MRRKEERNSSIEILRIFAIMIIIINHYALFNSAYGNAFNNRESFGLSTMIPIWMHFGGKMGVDIFVFISGYFLCKGNSFKLRKLVQLLLEILFYSVIIIIIGSIFDKTTFRDIVNLIFAVFSGYWPFMTWYVVLYILSPYINILLDTTAMKDHLILLTVLTIIWVIIPTFLFYETGIEYGLLWYIYVYVIAAFVRKIEAHIPRKPELFLLAGIFIIGLIFASEWFIKYISINYIEALKNGIEHFKRYNSFFVLSSTICLFLGLKQFKIRNNRIINSLASTTLAVYIMHDNGVLRNIIWQDILKAPSFQYSKWLLAHAIGSSIAIFLFFACIDLLRQRFIERPVINYIFPIIERWSHRIDKTAAAYAEKLK